MCINSAVWFTMFELVLLAINNINIFLSTPLRSISYILRVSSLPYYF